MNADSPAEPNHQASRALLDQIAANQLSVIVPTLLLVEVAGVINRTRGDAALGSRYAEAMRQLPFIQWVALDEAMAVRASALAATRALRGADAVYAAVAVAYGCELISLDREHLTRLPPVLRTSTPAEVIARGSAATS
jgi:predicted nucleic acid-binding protein